MPRRFPPPWTIDEANDACFIVRDHNGQALAYVYFEDETGRVAGLWQKRSPATFVPGSAPQPIIIQRPNQLKR